MYTYAHIYIHIGAPIDCHNVTDVQETYLYSSISHTVPTYYTLADGVRMHWNNDVVIEDLDSRADLCEV